MQCEQSGQQEAQHETSLYRCMHCGRGGRARGGLKKNKKPPKGIPNTLKHSLKRTSQHGVSSLRILTSNKLISHLLESLHWVLFSLLALFGSMLSVTPYSNMSFLTAMFKSLLISPSYFLDLNLPFLVHWTWEFYPDLNLPFLVPWIREFYPLVWCIGFFSNLPCTYTQNHFEQNCLIFIFIFFPLIEVSCMFSLSAHSSVDPFL